MTAVAPDTEKVIEVYRSLQDELCAELQRLDGGEGFISDTWEQGRSYGDTRVLERGELLERAGVNFSCVYGERLPPAATEQKPHLHNCSFMAVGVSVVLHPQNPYVPTAHMNVRFLQVQAPQSEWWFGGGFDLTPYYGFVEDCQHWHTTAKQCCSALDEQAYAKYKEWCDRYFYIEHRQEPRGVGGIFFDDLSEPDFPTCLDFAQKVARGLIVGWKPIAEKRHSTRWGERERDFQLYRRGRYAEFNLVQDRGTRFGLQFGGRIESILMSLPPLVRWRYKHTPEPDGAEAALYEQFLRPRDWLAEAGD